MAQNPNRNPLGVRLALALAGAVVVTAVVLGLLWYLSYGSTNALPTALSVDGLGTPTEVQWFEQGAPVITAGDERTFLSTLGYVHGQHHSWSTTLWRQTAAGRLAEWFGEDVLPLDRHARRLGFERLARNTFDEMPEAEQVLLESYTDGLNAALAQRSVRSSDEFALLRIEPEPWEPWHPLAIERMMAWLSTVPLSLEDAPGVIATPPAERPSIRHDSLRASTVFVPAPEPLTSFLTRDEQFREWLHLFGFDQGMAWAVRDSLGTHLYQRHAYGASALPLVQDVVWRGGADSDITIATIPGTLMTPAGHAGRHAWAVLLHGRAGLGWVSSPEEQEHTERLHVRSGDEHLLTVRTTAGHDLPLDDSLDATGPDSLLALRWEGLSLGSDLSAWRALREGSSPSFQLIGANGLRIDGDGAISVIGNPSVQYDTPQGVLVGNGSWAAVTAHQWERQLEAVDAFDPLSWADNTFSLWTQETTDALVAALEQQPFPSEAATEALTYLRNWNYSYEESSIAATIFDRWAAGYRVTYGAIPSPDNIDTAWPERERYYRLLQETVEQLREAHGDDPSLWRWEDAASRQRFYPVWSSPLLPRVTGYRNYPAQMLPGRGHPSSPSGGFSYLLDGPDTPASWEGWILFTDENGYFKSRQHQRRAQGFQARIVGADPSPERISLNQPTSPLRTTTLHPIE